MRTQHFFLKPVLLNHDLEVDVNVLSTSQVVRFLLFLLSFEVLHLLATLLALLLNALQLLHGISLSSTFHLIKYSNTNSMS